MKNIEKRAYNIADYAAMFGLNEKTVRVNVSRNPDLVPRVMRVGRSIFFTAKAIEDWEEKMQQS
jgi:hypothetical protein